MPYTFDASNDFVLSMGNINTLVDFATKERDLGNEDNRVLFLKLAVVSCVTKFQVYIERILKEFHYSIKSNNKKYQDVSIYLRLNSIKLFSSDNIIHKLLENPQNYSPAKLTEVERISRYMLGLCDNNQLIDNNLQFDTKFPLGKTGLAELSKLFRQINGENIFDNPPFDINKLNEILYKRHAIIHDDSNPQLTEETVNRYKEYMNTVMEYIDAYLNIHR